MAREVRYRRCADCGGKISYPNFGTDRFCWSSQCSPDRRGRLNPPAALDDRWKDLEKDIENQRTDIF